MARDSGFLRRWSRRKREAAAAPAAVPAQAPAAELPALDSITFESDFKAFMHAKVEATVKRAALKKLFSDPRFNVMDGLDVYIDDYSKNDPIPEEMLKTLEHARSTLFPPQEQAGEPVETAKAAEQAPEPEPDGNPRQDT